MPELIVTQEEGAKFFTDVKLGRNADGTFRLDSLQQQKLASIQSVSVEPVADTTTAVVVYLQGVRSLECVRFEPARITRHGNTFLLALLEQGIPPNLSCLAGQFPFLEYAVLNTANLEPGDYFVNAHGLTVGFSVNED